MKIETLEDGTLNLKEVFNGIQLESESGNKIFICMRDNGFEIAHKRRRYEAKDDLISLEGNTVSKFNITPEGLISSFYSNTPEEKTSILEENQELEALRMLIDCYNKYNFSNNKSVDLCIEKIEFMLQYNPCPINPSKSKKEYHDYWNHFIVVLKSLKFKNS
jgi:hypothetical protein